MRSKILCFAVLACILLSATPAAAAVKVVRRTTAHGDFAIAVAGSPNLREPEASYVKVKASPNQEVQVSWLRM